MTKNRLYCTIMFLRKWSLFVSTVSFYSFIIYLFIIDEILYQLHYISPLYLVIYSCIEVCIVLYCIVLYICNSFIYLLIDFF